MAQEHKFVSNLLHVYVHFVWATQDRLPILTAEIERDVYRYITTVCEDHGCPVKAIGGTENHVHLLVTMSCAISLGELMQHIKGGSSPFVSGRLRPGEQFAWQGHYGDFSLDAATFLKR